MCDGPVCSEGHQVCRLCPRCAGCCAHGLLCGGKRQFARLSHPQIDSSLKCTYCVVIARYSLKMLYTKGKISIRWLDANRHHSCQCFWRVVDLMLLRMMLQYEGWVLLWPPCTRAFSGRDEGSRAPDSERCTDPYGRETRPPPPVRIRCSVS